MVMEINTETEITTPVVTESIIEPELPQPTENIPEPAYIEAELVMEALTKSSLPAAAKKRLAGQQFKTLEEMDKSIQDEIEYLSEITGAGRVVGLGELHVTTKRTDPAQVDAAKDRVIKQYFG
jgi:hypothetical protein